MDLPHQFWPGFVGLIQAVSLLLTHIGLTIMSSKERLNGATGQTTLLYLNGFYPHFFSHYHFYSCKFIHL